MTTEPGSPGNEPCADPFLDHLTEAVTRMGPDGSIGVTLFAGAGPISGSLITYEAWRRLFFQQFPEHVAMYSPSGPVAPPWVQPYLTDLRAQLAEHDRGPSSADRFVHLKDAFIPVGLRDSWYVPLWRGRREDVHSWMLGSPRR
ncbi:hypothetical protein MF672_046655 [Actinomadura sp. ATCC 31491]|uniref:Uncharacterized protein n=1 Tax=Actinomadura luzonensis TaxID=2805427 RepID=A0ABT0GAI4_9ACTN|nr:hypothetical protein [Actinomadura luzonensis]MCK2221235.1 hypothetical protein [Actinomadura luzonensis]